MITYINKIVNELKELIKNNKDAILQANNNIQHIAYGIIMKYYIIEGYSGAVISSLDNPNFTAQGSTYLYGATPQSQGQGAIIRLSQSPEELSTLYGPPINLIGKFVEITYTGNMIANGVARIINNYGTESPKVFTKPDKKCILRTAVSAKL